MIKKALVIAAICMLSACAKTTYWQKAGGNQYMFDQEQADCHTKAFFLPQKKYESPTPYSYQMNTTFTNNIYNTTIMPYKNPYQGMADAFGSLGATLHNIEQREQFMESCMKAKGWQQIEESALSITVAAHAVLDGGKETYEGTATGYADRTGTIKMKNSAGNLCVGNFRYTHDSGGDGLVRCDDGQSAAINFTAITQTSGFGSGTSNQGKEVKFTYGLEPDQREQYLK